MSDSIALPTPPAGFPVASGEAPGIIRSLGERLAHGVQTVHELGATAVARVIEVVGARAGADEALRAAVNDSVPVSSTADLVTAYRTLHSHGDQNSRGLSATIEELWNRELTGPNTTWDDLIATNPLMPADTADIRSALSAAARGGDAHAQDLLDRYDDFRARFELTGGRTPRHAAGLLLRRGPRHPWQRGDPPLQNPGRRARPAHKR